MPGTASHQQLHETLDKAWRSTCRVLFGEEIGGLSQYEDYLKSDLPAPGKRSSHLSGKAVTLASDDHCRGANFISSDEMAGREPPKLSINEMKDMAGGMQ